jgi:4-hydroxybenzoate polyprenyltransferase
MPPFFRLLRIPNLLIIAASMFLIKYAVMQVFVNASDLSFQLEPKFFFLLVLSVLLIAAGGYLINDYFDIDIDTANKPNDVIVGKEISPNAVMTIYAVFNGIGILLAYFVAAKVGVTQLAFVHVITVGLLWFYSSEFKKMLIIGNVIIALLSATVFFIPVMFEIPLLIKQFKKVVVQNEELFLMYKQIPLAIEANFRFMWYWASAFAVFAFLISFCREIIKDCQDVEGDERFGASTLPARFGLSVSNKVVILFLLTTVSLLAFAQYNIFIAKDYYSFSYILVFFQIPLMFLIYKTYNAYTSNNYKQISIVLKFLMVFGLGYGILFYYLMK